jgi:hypothetical protein
MSGKGRPFAKGAPKPASSGRRAGTPNKGTERARRLISEGDDKEIVGQVVRGAKANNQAALALYFRYLRPPLSRTAYVEPIDLEPPRSAEEARDAIARITSMIAKAEIDGEHGGRIIAGLEAFLGARAAELEAEVEKHRAEEGL